MLNNCYIAMVHKHVLHEYCSTTLEYTEIAANVDLRTKYCQTIGVTVVTTNNNKFEQLSLKP